MLIVELFAEALRSLKTCVLVNNNLYGKLISLLKSPITFDERFKVTLGLYIFPNFNILS